MQIESLSLALLAAGGSTRYGPGNKLLGSLNGKPLIAHAALTLSGMSFFEQVAICRAEDIEIHSLLEAAGYRIVINPNAADGQSTSVKAAAQAALSCGAAGLMIALGDMPAVPESHFRALADALDPAFGRDVTASLCAATNIRQPPACFAKSQLEALLKSQGDKGARNIIATAHCVTASAEALKDYDRPGDFDESE